MSNPDTPAGARAVHPYLAHLLEGQSALPAAPTDGLKALRAHAVDRVSALTVPTTRDEAWRFTDLAPLLQRRFQPADAIASNAPEKVAGCLLPEAAARLVFVDGVLQPQFCVTNDRAITFTTLADGRGDAHARACAEIGRLAAFEDSVFAALNTAFIRDAAVVVVPRGVAAAYPVHLLYVATQTGAAIYPRVLVVAEAASRVTVVEDFAGVDGAAYLNAAVAEIRIDDEAQVRHVKLQREATDAFHFATTAVRLARNARFASTVASFGARLSRHDLNVEIAGEGAECSLAGLALIGGRQLADTHSTIDHAVAHGRSRQLHKAIVGGNAHAVFNGRILVRPGAQLTDSGQQSRNLLLSGRARVDTKPQLEIFADDVKCAHGATVGQIDAEELFYLRSRGLPEAAARNLLTYAFGAEVVDRIPLASLKTQLEELVLARTAGA